MASSHLLFSALSQSEESIRARVHVAVNFLTRFKLSTDSYDLTKTSNPP